jgi:hypothetical protein
MDPSCNDYEDNDFDNIRSPDKVKTERLLEDTRSQFDKEIDEVIYLSTQELREQYEENKKYEEYLLNEYSKITIERREQFRGLLLALNKLIRYDENIKEIYNIIEPIIDSYCVQYITYCEFDNITYDRIFSIIASIRTQKNNIELLKKIIIKSE